jgi:replicative DNA helicase
MKDDFSQETERDVLAGILVYPDSLIRYKNIIHRDLFHYPDHKTILDVIIRSLEEERYVDATTISAKISQAGYTDSNNRSLAPYVKHMSAAPVPEESLEELIYQLVDLHYSRKGKTTCQQIQSILSKDLPLAEKYNKANEIFVDGLRIPVNEGNKPVKLWEGYMDKLEYKAANPEEFESIGYEWPYPTVTQSYGKLRKGCVHVIVARGGVGKSTVLNHVGQHLLTKYDLPILILDTEMKTEVVQHRMFASLSGASVFSLEENKWFQNSETKDKVYSASKKIPSNSDIYHLYVGGKSIEEIEALVLDFYYTKVGSGNTFALMYDYVKCDSSALKNNWAEHQALGDHMDKLHQLAYSLDCVVLTAAQANRSGDSFNRNSAGIADDSTAIADSDRIQRYAEFVAILRTKTVNEIALDEGVEEEDADLQRAISPLDLRRGTHMFTVIKSRHGGERAAGHIDFVTRMGENNKLVSSRNYVNLSIHNFDVQDRGDLRAIIAEQSEDHEVVDENDGFLEQEDLL